MQIWNLLLLSFCDEDHPETLTVSNSFINVCWDSGQEIGWAVPSLLEFLLLSSLSCWNVRLFLKFSSVADEIKFSTNTSRFIATARWCCRDAPITMLYCVLGIIHTTLFHQTQRDRLFPFFFHILFSEFSDLSDLYLFSAVEFVMRWRWLRWWQGCSSLLLVLCVASAAFRSSCNWLLSYLLYH